MIKRPEDLIIKPIKIIFNERDFNKLELDLSHINKAKRSSYTVANIESVLVSSINNKVYSPSAFKVYGGDNCSYYVILVTYKAKPHKLVLCICSDRPNTLGIITFYREKR